MKVRTNARTHARMASWPFGSDGSAMMMKDDGVVVVVVAAPKSRLVMEP